MYGTPVLSTRLVEEGRQFLTAHGVNEPLTWHPPLRLLDGLTMPNPDVERIDIGALHRLANQPKMSIQSLARTLRTSQDTVRYLLDEHPVELARKTSSAANRRAFARPAFHTVLTAAVLEQLYHREQLSLQAIGDRYDISIYHVWRLARANGIAMRNNPPPPDRDWLYTQYIHKHRTTTDIAIELGRSPSTIQRWIKRYEIAHPVRDSTAQHCDELTPAVAQSLLAPVLTRRAGRTMLENFTVLLAHPTIRATATTLGLSEQLLQSRIKVLEKVFGDPLLFRSRTNCDMTPTPLGARVAEAVSVLQACDRW
jgi:DNA-binding Lrp family transcriptional regulator